MQFFCVPFINLYRRLRIIRKSPNALSCLSRSRLSTYVDLIAVRHVSTSWRLHLQAILLVPFVLNSLMLSCFVLCVEEFVERSEWHLKMTRLRNASEQQGNSLKSQGGPWRWLIALFNCDLVPVKNLYRKKIIFFWVVI